MTKKLLLADDSITIQKVIGIIFETEDYQLLVTDNGDDALTKAREELPDLVIADISMPGKDGFELCQAIKSDPRLSNASVMLLPGTFDHFDEDRAQSVGADGWLTKPFESQALLNKVAQLLEAEPVRLAADVPHAAETDFTAELEPPVVAGIAAAAVAAPVLDEDVLGLGAVAEGSVADEAVEGADDIWDAVSFEDDDLSAEEEPAFADAADVETVAVAGSAEESPFDWAAAEPATEESVFEMADEAPLELVDELAGDSPVADGEGFVLPEDAGDEPLELEDEVLPVASLGAADFGFEELEPLSLAAETADVDDIEFEEPMLSTAPVSAEQPEDVDGESFAAGSLTQEEEELPVVELLNEESLGEDEEILDLADEDILEEEPLLTLVDAEEPEPIELDLEEVDGAGVVFADDVPPVEEVAAPLVAEESDDLMAEFAEEPVAEEPIAEEPIAEEPIAEEPIAEEPIAEEPVAEEPIAEEPIAEEPIAEEPIAEEPIAEEPIAEEPIVEEPIAEEPIAEESIAEEPVAEEPIAEEPIAEEPIAEEPIAEEPIAEEPIVEEPIAEEPIAEESIAEEPVAGFASDGLDEVVDAPGVEDDEGFYFDASEADGVAVAAVAAGAGAAATVSAVSADSGAGIEQVEQQLRQLSDDDLRDVVGRVAGPIIERLAGEMVERIAWEVVPDLAESMIREEIRKIKSTDE